MCIYLFYQIRKTRRNRKAREEHTQPAERVQAKQESLCEHQLADAAKGDDGVLNSTMPGLEHQQRPVEQRGSTHCPECIVEKKRARVYRLKILISLVMANMMASMDLTIIATALPTIASHFCKFWYIRYRQRNVLLTGLSCTRTVQLDRHSIHASFNIVDTALRANLGRFWPTYSPPGVHFLHSDRQRPCCRRASVGHAAGGPRSARTRLCRVADHHESHPVRQSVSEGHLVQQHAVYLLERGELLDRAGDWRVSDEGEISAIRFVVDKPN
jgi:hypothetical protein